MRPATKAAAQLIIKRPDGTETRFVRRKPRPAPSLSDADLQKKDEDREMVAACPPYTASFNALLKDRKEANSRVLVTAVLERMHAEAIPLNVVTYNLLMERVVCLPGDLVFNLYEEMMEEAVKENSSVQPDLNTYQLLFRACERKGQYSRAFLFYKQMRDLIHVTPDAPTYDTLLGFCAAVKDVAQAAYFMEEMERTGVMAKADTYNCLMSVLLDSAPYGETLKVLQRMTETSVRPTIRTYNTVIKAARMHGDYDRAFQLFEELKKRGMLPDVVTYNTLLSLAEQRLDYVMGRGTYEGARRTWEQRRRGSRAIADLALTLYGEMDALHIAPNTFTLNQMLSLLLHCGDRRVFSVYSTLLKRCASEPSPPAEVNVSLDEVMGEEDPRRPARVAARRVRPNVDTYRLLVRSCLFFGYAGRCDKFYQNMRQKGLPPDHDFAILMQSVYETTKDAKRAYEVLLDAKNSRVLIDAPLYNAYLNVLAVCGDVQLVDLLRDMQLGINAFGVKADVATCNAALRGYITRDDYDGASSLFSSMYMAYSVVVPDADTYCWMLRAYRVTHNTTAATQLIHSMRQRQVPLLLKHYHELMRVFLEVGDERVVETFQALRGGSEGMPKADVECFHILLQHYVKQQRWEELQRLFAELKADANVEVDTGCYNSMLEMVSQHENVGEARTLFEELRMQCITPDLVTYNTLLRIFAPSGDDAMYLVLDDMRLNHMAPAESTLAILIEYAEGRRVISTAVERDLFWDPSSDFAGWSNWLKE